MHLIACANKKTVAIKFATKKMNHEAVFIINLHHVAFQIICSKQNNVLFSHTTKVIKLSAASPC